MPPPKGLVPNRGIEVSRPAAMLCLWSALLGRVRAGEPPTGLSLREWEAVVATLSPREIVVVAFHVIGGLSQHEVGAWLEVSHSRVYQHLTRIKAKLRAACGETFTL